MSQNRVLSIQSHVVSGYVGNRCAVFPLQVLGFEVDFINSVQFSNHTGYGQWKGQVLNEKDLDDLYEGLKTNHLANYDKILTGYVGSESFLRKICQVVKDSKARTPGCTYLCDPVLGDDGHFYVPPALIPIYVNEVLPLADIVTPNTFEMELLTDMKIKTEEDVIKACGILHDKGISTVVLSSLDAPGAPELTSYVSHKHANIRRMWKANLKKISGKFTGSGDLFSALFLGWSSKLNHDIPKVLTTTLATMSKVLQRTRDFGEAETKRFPNKPPCSAPTELQLIQSIDDIRSPVADDFKAIVVKV